MHRPICLIITILLATVILSSCASTSTESAFWRDNRFLQGAGNTHYQERLFLEEGWEVWRRLELGRGTCFAYKPANGFNAPEFPKDLTLVSGSVGFFMAMFDPTDRIDFGFFAKYPFSRRIATEFQGESIDDLSSLEEPLSWEGSTLDIRVESRPTRFSYEDPIAETAKMDFTGITNATRALGECFEQSR